MCPVCIATAAWIAAGTASTGGVSALIVNTLRSMSPKVTTNSKIHEQGEEDGQEQ